MVDDPVTVALNRNSAIVGRAQGLLVALAMDSSNVFTALSVVFTSMQLSGSTIETQGTSRQLQNYRELTVVSGNGRFRFARGFAVLETISFDVATNYSIIRLTITLLKS